MTIESASVTPKRFFFDSGAPAEVRFTIQSPAPADMAVYFVRGGEEARVFQLQDVPAGAERVVRWNGIYAITGRPAAEGTFNVLIGEAGGPAKNVGKVTLRGHIYPVRGRTASVARSGTSARRVTAGAPMRASTSSLAAGHRSSPRGEGSSSRRSSTPRSTGTT